MLEAHQHIPSVDIHSNGASVDEIQNQEHKKDRKFIPASAIIIDSEVDPDHVDSLLESMDGPRGQISPITVRDRIHNGKIVYDVIDGFHRSTAFKLKQQREQKEFYVDAVVVLECDDEELFDLRVLAASSATSVSFSRMAGWMQKSIESAKWENERLALLVNERKLKLLQVFSIAYQDSSGRKLQDDTGERLNLSVAEAEELKAWARSKAIIWRKQIGTLVVELRTIEFADPELVQMVTKGGGGKDRRGVLTHARLNKIAEALPYQFDMQRKVVTCVLNNNIVAEQIPELTSLIMTYDQSKTMDIEERDARITEILTHPLKFISDRGERKKSKNKFGSKKSRGYEQDTEGMYSEDDVFALIEAALDALLSEEELNEDGFESVFHNDKLLPKVRELRVMLGVEAKSRYKSKVQVKSTMVENFSVSEDMIPMATRDKQMMYLDIMQNRIITVSGECVFLSDQETYLLSHMLLNKEATDAASLRGAVYGEDRRDNANLDVLIHILKRSLRSKLSAATILNKNQ